MAHDPHIVPRVPRLTGLAWPHVAPYLEEFLKRLLAASDSAHIDLAAISGEDTGDELAARRPTAHRHHAEEVGGLEEPFRTRRPAPHTHRADEVLGSTGQSEGVRLAHTHRPDEVVGLIGDTQLILQSRIFGG